MAWRALSLEYAIESAILYQSFLRFLNRSCGVAKKEILLIMTQILNLDGIRQRQGSFSCVAAPRAMKMTVRTRTPSSSPPYALRKGEKDFVPLGKGIEALRKLRRGWRVCANAEAGTDAIAPRRFSRELHCQRSFSCRAAAPRAMKYIVSPLGQGGTSGGFVHTGPTHPGASRHPSDGLRRRGFSEEYPTRLGCAV
jgi:hypothetical protein